MPDEAMQVVASSCDVRWLDQCIDRHCHVLSSHLPPLHIRLPIASPPRHHIYRSTSHRVANVTLAVRWVRGVARLATLPRNHLAVEVRGGFVRRAADHLTGATVQKGRRLEVVEWSKFQFPI